jgi:hypothetical protein
VPNCIKSSKMVFGRIRFILNIFIKNPFTSNYIFKMNIVIKECFYFRLLGRKKIWLKSYTLGDVSSSQFSVVFFCY